MKKTVQPKMARNKPGASKTEIALAEKCFQNGTITSNELADVKNGIPLAAVQFARQHKAERELVDKKMRAATIEDAADMGAFARAVAGRATCIEGEFTIGGTAADRAIITSCHLAERLAGLLEDTASDIEDQLRKVVEAEG